MKTFVGAITAFLVLIAGIVAYDMLLYKTEDGFMQLSDELEQAILNADAAAATEKLLAMEKKWDGSRTLLMAFSEHSELNSIEERIKNMRSALIFGDYPSMYRELNAFKMFLKYTFSGSRPTLTNIL